MFSPCISIRINQQQVSFCVSVTISSIFVVNPVFETPSLRQRRARSLRISIQMSTAGACGPHHCDQQKPLLFHLSWLLPVTPNATEVSFSKESYCDLRCQNRHPRAVASLHASACGLSMPEACFALNSQTLTSMAPLTHEPMESRTEP